MGSYCCVFAAVSRCIQDRDGLVETPFKTGLFRYYRRCIYFVPPKFSRFLSEAGRPREESGKLRAERLFRGNVSVGQSGSNCNNPGKLASSSAYSVRLRVLLPRDTWLQRSGGHRSPDRLQTWFSKVPSSGPEDLIRALKWAHIIRALIW